jgi:nicotinate-nucleotide adenylyltransferase
MRIGVMGGTFDPIHIGHLVAASEVAHRFALERVVFVPTGRPWQKFERQVSAPEDRYLMTVIATAADERFSVSRVDVDRSGPTYTVDTLRDIRRDLGDEHDYHFITGADALGEILSWREPEEVLRLAHLVGVTRPGHVLADPGLAPGRVTLLEIPALAISSSDIRARVERGEPIRYLVTPGVEAYIRKVGLYAG